MLMGLLHEFIAQKPWKVTQKFVLCLCEMTFLPLKCLKQNWYI